MKYKILLPLLISGLFFACSKDDKTTDVPGDTILETYYPGTTMEIKELSIYTSDGVITDPAFIQGFIDRNVIADAKSSYYVGVSSIPVPASNQILHFLNNNRVNMNNVNMEIKGYKDSVMLIAEYTSTPFPTFATSCGALLARVPEYSPFNDCPDGTCASYRRTYPLIVSGANYIAPLVTYTVVTNDCAITPSEIPGINFRSRDLQTKLVAGDSVLVQYARLPLIKKVD
jgi:hypothetical protein